MTYPKEAESRLHTSVCQDESEVFSHSVAACICTDIALNNLPSSVTVTAVLVSFLIHALLKVLKIAKYVAGQ